MITRFGISKGKQRSTLKKACLGILIIALLVMNFPLQADAAIFTGSPPAASVVPVQVSADIKAESFSTNAVKDKNILTMNKPSGVQKGDLLIAQITYEKGKDALPMTAPAGWTQINVINAVERSAGRNDGTDLGQAIYWKGAGSNEPSSYSWKFKRPIKSLGGIIRYSGVNTKHPDGPIISSGGLGYDQNISKSNALIAPGLNGGFSTKLIAFYAIKEKANLQTPVAMSRIYQKIASSNDYTIMSSDEDWNSSASTGQRVAYSFRSDGWVKAITSKVISQLIVLRGWIPTTLTVENAEGAYGDNVDLSAKLTSNGMDLSGYDIAFKLGGKAVGTATTDINGVATLNDVNLEGYGTGEFTNEIAASFAGDTGYLGCDGSADLKVLHGFTVTFHSDGDDIDPINLLEGHTISQLPVPAKDNMILLGWFTDDVTFTNKVTEDTPIYANLDLYALYLPADPLAQTDEQTSTSVLDVAPDYHVTVLSSVQIPAEAVKNAISVESSGEEEEEFGGLSVTGGSGSFTVAATKGFKPGGSYTLTLTDSTLTFEGQESNVRSYNITVTNPDPVLNLRLKSSVKPIPTTDITGITQNGITVGSIFAPLFELDDENNPVDNTFTGTFDHMGDMELLLGDTLAVYEGTVPGERIAGFDYSGQNIAYVSVTAVSGSTISYANAEVNDVLFTPEVFPVNIMNDEDGDPLNSSLTIEISKITGIGEVFAKIDENYDLRHDSSTVVEADDFLAFYEEPLDADALVGYARIKEVKTGSAYYVITYETVTVEELLASMDIAASQELTFDQLDKSSDMKQLEEQLREQVTESGFIDSASDFLVKLANTDEDTREQIIDELGISNFSIIETESPVMLAASQSVEVDYTFRISPILEHYEGENGLKCDITITCEITLGSNVSITVTGTFTQEIKIELDITGEATLAWALFIPIPIEFSADASVSIYSYTSLSLNALLTTSSGKENLDIREQIASLGNTGTGSLPPEEKSKVISEFYELYQDMLSQEHDYFELFKIPIVQFKGGVDPLHLIGFGVSVDFVVSVDANVSLGVEFGYEKATRYSVHLDSGTKTATTKQTDLVDGDYAFIVYVMGTLGLRAGVKATLEIGFLDTDLDSIGFSVELGAYWRMWGFVYYELVHENNVTTSSYGGGIYMELGIYLEIDFIAQVLNHQYEYVATLFEQEWPLLSIGDRYYVFDYEYQLDDSSDDIVLTNVNTYVLPEVYRKMYQMDYKTGSISSVAFAPSDFTYSIEGDSHNAFSVNAQNSISVKPPANTSSLSAKLVVAWNKNPLSFTSSPLSRTFDLNWSGPVSGSYCYHFETNGGFPINSIRIGYGYKLDAYLYPTPRRTGYTFTGWFSDSTFEHVLDPNYFPTSDVTLYARWQPNWVSYTVRNYEEQLNGSFPFIYSYQVKAWADSQLTDSPFTRLGLVTPEAQSIRVSPDSSTLIDYYYELLECTYTFKLNNGGADIVGTMPYGTRMAAPSLVKPGYAFTGWSPAVPARLYNNHVTYEAQWVRNEYAIAYDLKGGSVASENPLAYNIDSTSMTLVNPTRTGGYVFVGWTGTGLSAPTMIVTIPQGSTGDRYYTAVWTTYNRYDIRHIRENLSGVYSLMELEFGAGGAGFMTDAQPKTYEGFTAILPVLQKTIGSQNETVVSIYYSRNSYTLTFDAASGVGGGAQSVKYGASIYAAYVNTAPVSREGYSLNGWSPAMTAGMTMPLHDMTLTAQWTRLDYIISYILNGGSVSGTNPGGYNTNSDAITIINPTKPGYIFAGWTGTGLSAPTLLLTIPTGSTGNRQYTANWTEDSTYYTLTFDANGGQGGVSLRLLPGDEITPPTVTRQFYIFSGWDADIPSVMPEHDLVFHANWDPIINIFTFDMNGADGVWTIPKDVYSWTGSPGILPSRLVGTGVELAGWNTSPKGTGKSYERGDFVYVLTPYNEDPIPLYAQWKPMDTFGVTDAMYMFTGQTFGLDENNKVTDAVYDSSVSGDKPVLDYPFGSAPFMYFRIKKTGDGANPFALYLYKCDGEYLGGDFTGYPMVPYDSEYSDNPYGAPQGSLIGSGNNDNLTLNCKLLLQSKYGSEWAKGLVTVGNITMLWEDSRYALGNPDYNPGFVFTSVNGVKYFISGRTSYSYGMDVQYSGGFGFTPTNSNPTIMEIDAINKYKSGPTPSGG